MTYFQIFSFIIGIGFTGAGLLGFKENKIWRIIFLVIGILVLKSTFFGEVSKSDDRQNEIVNLQLEEIEEILLLPGKRLNSLSKDTISFTSETEIRKFQSCLSKTKEVFSDSNSIKDWGCILKIKRYHQKDVLLGITKTENQTLLEIYSKGDYGVNYGTMLNNELGELIDQLVLNK